MVIKIAKKGDLNSCNNSQRYNTASKIFNKIIFECIVYALENNLCNEQDGFHPNRSCIDQINTLSAEFQSPLYMVFVGYKRAFDSLNRECIWKEIKAR
jgi:hypothetical protein